MSECISIIHSDIDLAFPLFKICLKICFCNLKIQHGLFKVKTQSFRSTSESVKCAMEFLLCGNSPAVVPLLNCICICIYGNQIYSNRNLATNKYPNIFVSKKLTRTNIRIYSYKKLIQMNIRINFRIKNI